MLFVVNKTKEEYSMRNFKKLLSVLLALAMLVGITAPSVVRA